MLEDSRLKMFLTVARLKNFTAAAKELNVSQPAVSQNIAELERQAGTALFERNRGEVTLTPRGEIFKLFASRIMKNYEDLNTVMSDFEAFESVSAKAAELSSDPLYHLFKDIL